MTVCVYVCSGRLFPQVVARTRSGSSPAPTRRPDFKMEGILNTGPPCPTSHMAMFVRREALPLLIVLEVRPRTGRRASATKASSTNTFNTHAITSTRGMPMESATMVSSRNTANLFGLLANL